jgi:PilZ domain
MVVVGNFRNQAELRRKPRRNFHYNASVLLDGTSPPRPCAIADISDTGARIMLEAECELPERFILLLTRSGEARRHCRLVWRDGLAAGVAFPMPASEAAE